MFSLLQDVPLSSMLAISVPTKAEPIKPNTTPHCFEIKVGREGVYYIGEKTSVEKSSVHSNSNYHFPADCGTTMEAALSQAIGEKNSKPWEEAIRNAFMPVTPKPSVKTVVSVTESASMSKQLSFGGDIGGILLVYLLITMLSSFFFTKLVSGSACQLTPCIKLPQTMDKKFLAGPS